MILPFVNDADACPICGVDHARLDDFRCCPDHGHELVRYGANAERDQYKCPVSGCKYERWIRRPPPRKEPSMTATPAVPATPSSEIAIRPGQKWWSERQQAALKQLGIADAPPEDLLVFLHYCQSHGLDPFSRHVTMIRYGDRWTIQMEIDGYRFKGHEAARRGGHTIAYRSPTYVDSDGQTSRYWVRREPPAMVEVIILKDGAEFPGQAAYHEFVRLHPKTKQPLGGWLTAPANQTAKCAEAQAWRKAFPLEFADIGDSEVVVPVTASPAAAATTWHAAAQISDTVADNAKAVLEQWERLGIPDKDEYLNLTAKLLGHDNLYADTLADFSKPDLQRAFAYLADCDDLGQVHALIGHGDKPGSTP